MSATGERRGAAEDQAGYTPDPRRWRALWVTLTAGFMSLLDVSIVAVALPSLREGLGASPAAVQWVVSGYGLAFGLALVPAGRLGDAYGRRRMFLAALAAFVTCSAVAGAAPTIGTLVAARLAQGLAAGTLAPQNSGLIQQLFRGAERARAFSFFGAMIGISTATGPVVGGLIIALAGGPGGWRWIFYVNVPIGLLALVLAARLLPHGTTRRREHIDLVGVGLLGGGVLSLMLPLVEADAGGLRRLWPLFGVGALLVAAFAAWERRVVHRGGNPLLDPRLLTRTSGYASGAALGTVYFLGFSGIWLVLAVFFQTGLGYTPLQSGLAVTPFALGSAIAAVFGGRLIGRLGRRLTVMGLVGVLVGLGAALLVLRVAPPHWTGWAIAPALLVAGLGGGLVVSPNLTLTLRAVPVEMAGSAGGALQTAQRFGAAIGTATLPALYYLVLAAGHGVRAAVLVALGAAAVAMVAALVVAVVEWRRDVSPDPADRPQHHPAEVHP